MGKRKIAAGATAFVLAAALVPMLAFGADGETEESAAAAEGAEEQVAEGGDEMAAFSGWFIPNEEDASRVITLDDGTQLQRVPDGYSNTGWMFGTTYNNVVLNADQRGCNACHVDLHGLILDAGHTLGYSSRYPARLTDFGYQDCKACHSDWYDGKSLKDGIHTMHMTNPAFSEMGGNCESCHYIDGDGVFHRWDDVKYDVMHGYIDLPADAVQADVSWDQDEITPVDQTVISDAPLMVDVEQFRTADYRDTYKLTFSGEMENPCSMSINEMIEKFGSETRVLAGQCIVNGEGGPLVQQMEMTGIPLRKVVEYLGLADNVGYIFPVGMDGYCYPTTLDQALDNDPLLVYELNGEELPSEYFPLYYFAENMAINNAARNLSEIAFQSTPQLMGTEGPTGMGEYLGEEYVYGDFTDTGGDNHLINRPNMGVLNAQDTQVFPAGETVHLEGYALATLEPIQKIEFSFDHGQTWKTVETTDTVPERWVYWRMDLPNLEAGSYLMEMRATSLMENGEQRVEEPVKFTFTLK